MGVCGAHGGGTRRQWGRVEAWWWRALHERRATCIKVRAMASAWSYPARVMLLARGGRAACNKAARRRLAAEEDRAC